MDCWNFSIKYLLKNKNIQYQENDFIFSEVFEWVTLLPKIWIELLNYYNKVIIMHECEDVFINLNEDEIPLKDEYIKWLEEFEHQWGRYENKIISLIFLEDKLKKYDCIIPIKKGEWSHLVVLKKIDNNSVIIIDNKKWEYTVTKEKFEDLINLHNWKYVLFCKY